jgi:hypothetical protein
MMLRTTSNAKLSRSGSGAPWSSTPRSSPRPSVKKRNAATIGPTFTVSPSLSERAMPVSVNNKVFGSLNGIP